MDVTFKKGDPRYIDYTPTADVAAGEVVVIGDIPAISHLVGGFTYDATRATRMMALAVGGGIYTCAADAVIAAGTLVYWDASANKVTETRTGNKTFGFTLEASTGDADEIPVLHQPLGAVDVESVAAVVAALTDNSGGAAADGTIGVITAPTSLTDNGGGTADGTVASMAAATTITDSTGLDGTHDDTIAAATLAAAITDNSGGVDPGDDTIASITNANNAGSADVVPTAAAVAQLAAKMNTTRTALGVITQNTSDLGQKLIEIVAWQTTVQNNVKELTTTQAENRTAIVALTDATKELATKINAILTALKNADLMASA